MSSIALTNAYRTRLLSLERRVATQARSAWPTIETFDDTAWPQHIGTVVTRAQRESVRASAGYLSSLLRSNRKPGRVALDSSRYAGVSRDGRPIAEALESALIGVTAALKDGREPAVALSIGLTRGLRMAQFETIQAGRDALLDATDEDERFTGWQRAVAGTCAACMALSGATGPHFEVHPSCQCVPQPVVSRQVRDVLKPGNLGSWKTAYDDAVDAIDDIHRYPADTATSSVGLGVRMRSLDASFNARTLELEMNPKVAAEYKTVLHELGHKLDSAMANRLASYASKEARTGGTPAMKELVSAMKKSDAYKTMGAAPEVASHRAYWRSAHEMFARAYAQWIHQRVGDGKWHPDELRTGVQWSDDDFKPVAEALENLLKEQGLLK